MTQEGDQNSSPNNNQKKRFHSKDKKIKLILPVIEETESEEFKEGDPIFPESEEEEPILLESSDEQID